MGEKDPDDAGAVVVRSDNRVIMHCLGHKEAILPLPGKGVAVVVNTIDATQARTEDILSCPKREQGFCRIGTSFRKPCSPDLVLQLIPTYTSSVNHILHQSDNIRSIPPVEYGEPVQHLNYQ